MRESLDSDLWGKWLQWIVGRRTLVAVGRGCKGEDGSSTE